MSSATFYNLHVNPTYAVLIPQRDSSADWKTERRVENEKNLTAEKHTGVLSQKATRRLSNAINWLVASAKSKTVYDKISGKRFSFRVNFVTLTLPTTEHEISDHFFKSVLLHNFINTCRYQYGLKNYVWKVEAQENGNIHAHFTTDTFIHWKDLRKTWNKILTNHGLMAAYTDKHKKMTLERYKKIYNKSGEKDIQQLKNAYDYGCSTGWTDPNTTDVHSVKSVKNLASYLAKYMMKNDEDRRKIKGRLWSCSTNLSESNKLVIEIPPNGNDEVLHALFHPAIAYKPLESINKLTRLPFQFGEAFFYKLDDWGKVLKGKLLELFNEHRFKIRHALQLTQPAEQVQFDSLVNKSFHLQTVQTKSYNQLTLLSNL